MIASSLLLAALLPPTGLVPITDFGAKPDGLLSAEDIAHVRVSGGFGILEALVDGWRSVPVERRPPLVRFRRCAGLCVESVALHNAPGKVVELADCENAIFNKVELTANVTERDFISTVSGPSPTVQSCSFRIGDGTWDVLDPRHRIVRPSFGEGMILRTEHSNSIWTK